MTTSETMLSQNPDWTFQDIESYDLAIQEIAINELNLDVYPNQIEIITAEQMIDAYASHGLPITYKHWSFGKTFLQNFQQYTKGKKNLAYEIVINSNPCIAYLMEENTLLMQALVIAHACYGHNAFFKGNYLFRQHTQADEIIDYMVYAQEYISRCEQKYGLLKVEQFIDNVHTLRNQGFHHYKRSQPLSAKDLEQKLEQQQLDEQKSKHPLWDKVIPKKRNSSKAVDDFKLPPHPTENILEFVEQYAPNMMPWQREVIQILRKIQEYFVPQMQTQLTNEGFATFVHHHIMHRLHEKGVIDQGFIQEFMISHTNVISQPVYTSKHYSGINPYALGFAMYTDIKRICTEPTEEDKRWFPNLIGKNWVEAIKQAAFDSRDETFVLQYLSPKVMRDFKLFSSVEDVEQTNYVEITGVCEDAGYITIRNQLAKQYNIFEKLPSIDVVDVDVRGNRRLTLHFTPKNETMLDSDSTVNTLCSLKELWGFEVCLKTMHPTTGHCINTYHVDKHGSIDYNDYDPFSDKEDGDVMSKD